MSRRAPPYNLLARMFLPHREPPLWLMQRPDFGLYEGVFLLRHTNVPEPLRHFALWELFDLPVLQSGQVGEILIYPLAPAYWGRLRVGQTLELQRLEGGPLSLQITESLDPPYVQQVFDQLSQEERAAMSAHELTLFQATD